MHGNYLLLLVCKPVEEWKTTKNQIYKSSSFFLFVTFFCSFSASIFTGIFIIAASYAECDKFFAVACFTISIAFQGVPGVAINALDLSPNYASILMGIGGAVTSITGILVPYMVGVVTPHVSTPYFVAVMLIGRTITHTHTVFGHIKNHDAI